MNEMITCIVEGLTFSFRKPRFENYQATHIIPPKSTVAGMIANALGHGESFYYRLLEDLKYAAILLEVHSRFVDLWTAIQGKGDESGKRGIFYREHLFRARYRMYFYSGKFSSEILEGLRNPQNIAYLGKSEDLAKIHSVERTSTKREYSKRIHSVIPINWVPLVGSIEWSQPNLRTWFPPTEESLITNYVAPSHIQAMREPRNVRKTAEVFVAIGGEFLLKETVEAFRVDEGYVYLI